MWQDVDTDAIDEELIEEQVYSILNQLHPRHAKVVMLRNGFGCTYKEIGDLFKVSASRIREIDLKGLRILRSDRYLKEFRKLDIPWIEQIFLNREREEKKRREERERLNREWHQKCIEEEIAKEKETKARGKLKIVDSDIPKPEAIVQTYSPKPPHLPPFFVKLFYTDKNEPYLHVDSAYGTIDRRLDPVTYDRWLAYLIDPKSTKVWNS